jgi:ERCC4-type nuclease
MIIKVDNRETELIRCIKYVLEISPMYKDVQMVVENLPLGDAILCKNDVEKVVIERKSLRDLAASIKDGRYEEQSYRLNGLPIHNHNIVYLVEGDVNKFNVFKDRMEKLTLYSAMVSLNFYKGFSVNRSINVEESALIICNMAHKIGKCEESGKQLFYYHQPLEKVEPKDDNFEATLDSSSSSTLDSSSTSASILAPPFSKVDKANDLAPPFSKVDYCTVAKKVKKDNVTPQNIGEIMLSQIPGVSSTTAIAIMEKFGTIQNLVMKINENEQCLKDLSYTSSKGQTRKISKPALNNIVIYLKPSICKEEKECSAAI